MDKFRNAYREAAGELPEFHIEASQVEDELHHHRMQVRRRKYLAARGCTAAAVFLLFGAGTAAAKNYRDSIVRVSDNGFIITSPDEDQEDLPDGSALPDPASILNLGGAFSIEEGIPEEETLEAYEPEITEYNSIEEFLTVSDMTAAIPDKALFGETFTGESVDVVEEGKELTVYLYNENVSFFMMQFDNRGCEGYSSATAFSGHSSNERSYTNSQGLSYVVFDSVNEKGETESVHAAISVNGRDLTFTFQGFDETVVEKILYTLDLSVYFQDER